MCFFHNDNTQYGSNQKIRRQVFYAIQRNRHLYHLCPEVVRRFEYQYILYVYCVSWETDVCSMLCIPFT